MMNHEKHLPAFPGGFVWGVATSAYQIEGAACTGGRGASIWDRFCSIPGNVRGMDTGLIACDHYNRFREDVALMKALGIQAYRLSVSWPRVLPFGKGAANEQGIAFYSDLIDELLQAGIEPYVTLYHWDLPQALQDLGGWTNPAMPGYFCDYAKLMFQRLGDRVKHWITLNEPYCSAFLGHYEGRMAPGLHDFSAAVLSSYHLYLGHGLAVRCFREERMDGEIGIALNLMGRLPLTDSDADHRAARRADGYLNRWFIEPILLKRYPQDMLDLYRSKGITLPEFSRESLDLIGQKLDFIGLNYYNDFYVRADESRWPLGFAIENPKNLPVTGREWPITPDGFTAMLLRLTREYGVNKILVTENGASFHDVIGLDGTVQDNARCDYLHRHILAMHCAMAKGAPVCGYFVWSLMDNFEWDCGYSSRFGLIHVDFATQKRTIKKSGRWYASLIASQESATPAFSKATP